MTTEGMQTTTLPTSLVRFRSELEAAIRREQEASRRTRPRVFVRAVLVAGAATVVAGALAVLPGDPAGELVEPASAARRAAAALTAPPDSIVHAAMLVTARNADGSHTSWREESWQQTAPPYDRRAIVIDAKGETVETATVDGSRQLYDPDANTIYASPSSSTPGTAPERATPEPASAEPLREQVLELLRSGKLTPLGPSVVDGRRTISFAWNDGHTRYEYRVEARTFEPVQWRITPNQAAPTVSVEFETYETLPASEVSLDLTDHHPGATVQRRP